jgi:hypothetical protein
VRCTWLSKLTLGLGSLLTLQCATAEDPAANVLGAGAGGTVGGGAGAHAVTGGTFSTGGVATGGVAGGDACPSGQKRCGGVCVTLGPSNGCAPDTCTPCTPPLNGFAVCSGTQCDFACNSGYVKSGTACISSGTGGTGGAASDACQDGVQNGAESDVDCGGSVCPKCGTGRLCATGGDCESGVCDQNCTLFIFCDPYRCVAPSCSDRVKNGQESDVDCGGSCGPCDLGRLCNSDTDCASGACDPDTGRCVEACVSGACACEVCDAGCEAGSCDPACEGGPCGSPCEGGSCGRVCEGGPDVCAP